MTEPGASVPFPVTFAVSNSRPPVDLSLRAAEDGTFVVDVMTQFSLAQRLPVRLGAFRGRLAPGTLARLVRVAAASRAAAAASSAASSATATQPMGSVGRLISVGAESRIVAVGEEQDLAALDDLLAEAAAAALADPIAAVTVGAHPAGTGTDAGAGSGAGAGDGGDVGAGARLVITASGSQAIRLLFWATDDADHCVQVWAEKPAGNAYLPVEAVAELVKAGAIPEGAFELAPGESITIPLPADVQGSGASAGGGFMFWRADQGPRLRMITGSWWLPAAATG